MPLGVSLTPLSLGLGSSAVLGGGQDGPLSLRFNAGDEIDSRIEGLDPEDAMPMFTGDVTGTPVSYTRNTGCWAADVAGITAISVWNTTHGNQSCATAISPRHVVMAEHFLVADGAQIKFVTLDNTIITRTLELTFTVVGDLCVGILDSDLPASIVPMKTMKANYVDAAPSLVGLPLLTTNQLKLARLANVTGLFLAATPVCLLFQDPSLPPRSLFAFPTSGGDSGHPYCLVINGELVLMGLFLSGTGAGPFPPLLLSMINGTMIDLSDIFSAPFYQIGTVDLTGFTPPAA